MRESVQLDFIGEMHIDFEDKFLVYVKSGNSRLRLPARIDGRQVAVNKPLSYSEVQWIGSVTRRQWWLLFPGIFFTLFGPIWASQYIGDWGPFTVSMVWFIVLGVFPLLLLARGRTYLGIATTNQVIVFPIDRQQKKVARVLGLLKQSCQSPEVQWRLDGTAFEDLNLWDNRLPTGKGFDRKRYIRITTIAGLYGLANLLSMSPKYHSLAVTLLIVVTGVVLFWVIQFIYCKLRK